MYMTSALGKNDMKAIGLQMALDLLAKKEKKDSITGLQTRTQPGRPDWNKVKASESPAACRGTSGAESLGQWLGRLGPSRWGPSTRPSSRVQLGAIMGSPCSITGLSFPICSEKKLASLTS